MFHYINRAWLEILTRRLQNKKIESVFCLYENVEEQKLIQEFIKKYNLGFKMASCPALWLKENQQVKRNLKIESFDLAIFDDILISHDLNDIYVKNYLAKHCKRINKNLK